MPRRRMESTFSRYIRTRKPRAAENAAAFAAAETPEARSWLALLPQEVFDRIVLHALNGRQNDFALRLAQTSQKLKNAVVSSFSNKFDMVNIIDRRGDMREWTEVFGDEIREVDLTVEESLDIRYTIKDLLERKSLSGVAIVDEPYILRTVAASTSIRKLHITLQNYKRQGDLSKEFLEQALSCMKLEKLSLTCCDECAWTSSFCPFEDDRYLNPEYATVPYHLGSLTCLEIECSRAERYGIEPVWRIFPVAPALQEISFCGDVPDELLPRVQALEKVNIMSGARTFETALRVGPAVKQLVVESTLKEEQLAQLTELPSLTHLSVVMEPGAEIALPRLTERLCELAALDLSWDSPFECLHGSDRPHYPCYAVSIAGVLENAIEGAPNLADLRLAKVRISLSETKNIMRHLGAKLKSFSVSVRDQDETQLDRLEAMLCIAAKHNTGLLEFRVLDIGGRDGYSSRQEARDQGARIRSAVDRLQQSAPCLDASEIVRNIAIYL